MTTSTTTFRRFKQQLRPLLKGRYTSCLSEKIALIKQTVHSKHELSAKARSVCPYFPDVTPLSLLQGQPASDDVALPDCLLFSGRETLKHSSLFFTKHPPYLFRKSQTRIRHPTCLICYFRKGARGRRHGTEGAYFSK